MWISVDKSVDDPQIAIASIVRRGILDRPSYPVHAYPSQARISRCPGGIVYFNTEGKLRQDRRNIFRWQGLVVSVGPYAVGVLVGRDGGACALCAVGRVDLPGTPAGDGAVCA